MNIQTVQLGSQSIRTCIKKGEPNTTPLLIMNGIGASLTLLTLFVESLPEDLEVITYDSPGVGESSTPSLPYRFSGLARTVSQMLDVLGYEQVDVLGLSWGGFLSQEFAYNYPKRCRKLILAATSSGVFAVPPSLRVLSLMSSPRRYTDSEYAAKISPEIYGGSFRRNKELVTKHASKMSNKNSNSLGYMYQTMAVYWWSSLPWLLNLMQPTLILAGGDDPLIPLCNMKTLNNLIPNSEMYVFEEEGHLFLLTEPEVVPLIEEFLK